jgi:hypothetical protein
VASRSSETSEGTRIAAAEARGASGERDGTARGRAAEKAQRGGWAQKYGGQERRTAQQRQLRRQWESRPGGQSEAERQVKEAGMDAETRHECEARSGDALAGRRWHAPLASALGSAGFPRASRADAPQQDPATAAAQAYRCSASASKSARARYAPAASLEACLNHAGAPGGQFSASRTQHTRR